MTVEWAAGYEILRDVGPSLRRADYSLRGLAAKGLLDTRALSDYEEATGLGDVGWHLLWAGEGVRQPGDALSRAEGALVFVHGWDGSGEVWEELPGLILAERPGLVALAPDVNGFGGTPFVTDVPDFEWCSPPGLMSALERWIGLLGLRDAKGERPFTFVGHSMGGAALFFLEDDNWGPFEVGRVAASPALLLKDGLRQGFYRALGAGIMLSAWSEVMDWLQENFVAPKVIETLAGWASDFVKEEHQRIYESTPEGVIARTFAAMGRLEATFDRDRWRFFRVFLAHRDRLVGLTESLELLEELNFEPGQIRVVLGDHYFFSVGRAQPKLHTLNRALLRDEILNVHGALLRREAV